MSALKYLVTGVSAVLLGRYFMRLSRLSNKAVVQLSGRVHKLDFKGVELAVDYNIKNPTSTSIRMSVPLITLDYKGSTLASSSMDATKIPEDSKDRHGRIIIGPNKETGFISTRVLIPLLTIPVLAKDLMFRLNDKSEKVKFKVKTTATVFTAIKELPYNDEQILEV